MNWLEKPAAIWRAVINFLRNVRDRIATSGWWRKLESWQYDPPAIKFTQWLKMGGVVVLVFVGVFMTGRLTARSNVAVLGFALPAADYSQPVGDDGADPLELQQCTNVAWAWKERAEKAEAELALKKGDALTVKTAANLECKPKVMWRTWCPKPTTLLQDWGVVK